MTDEIQHLLKEVKNTADFLTKAKLLKAIIDKHKVKLKDVSTFLQIKPSYLSHIMRLNRLPDIVIDGYVSNLVSVTHLFIIARLKNETEMLSAYERILSDNLTVLQTEELVRESLYAIKSEGERITQSDMLELTRLISEGKDVKVKLIQTRVKTRIIIEKKGSHKTTSEFIQRFIKKLKNDR